MSDDITFYFDFSSSYSYMAQARVNEIEDRTGKVVLRRPIVLGAIFQSLEHKVPAETSSKMKYLSMDLKRCAGDLGIAFKHPPVFPFNGILAMRVFYDLDASDQDLASEFTRQVFNAAYTQDMDISQPEQLATLMSAMGLQLDEIVNADSFADAKVALKQQTQAAMTENVFGAPTFIYQHELFWGADRIDMLINRASGR